MPRNNSSRHSQFSNSQTLGITIEEFNQQRLNYDPDPKRSEKLVKATKDFYSSHNLGYDHYAKAYQEVLALCLYPHEVRQALMRLEEPRDYDLEIISYHKMVELSTRIEQLSDIQDHILRLDDSNLSVFYRSKWNEFFAKETPLFKSFASLEIHLDNHLLNKAVTSSLFKQWYQLQLISPKDDTKVINPYFQKLLYHDQIAQLHQELMVESNFYHAYNTFATSLTKVRKEESHIFVVLDILFFKEVDKLQNYEEFEQFYKNDIVQSYMYIRPGIRLMLKEVEADLKIKELLKSHDHTLLTNSLFLTEFKRRYLIQRRINEITNH